MNIDRYRETKNITQKRQIDGGNGILYCLANGEMVYKSQEAPHMLLHFTRRDLKRFQAYKKPNA
jgi:hypothetical protein